jgi:hypothetical protein
MQVAHKTFIRDRGDIRSLSRISSENPKCNYPDNTKRHDSARYRSYYHARAWAAGFDS